MQSTPPFSMAPTLLSPLLLVEDEPWMQVRLVRILGQLGYDEADLHVTGSVAATNTLLATQAVAIALIDIGLPDGSGLELVRSLHLQDPALPILIVSALTNEATILSALRAGATGYVLKDRDDVEIAMSITSALRGGAPIDPFVAKNILALVQQQSAAPQRGEGAVPQKLAMKLSPREVEILALVNKGHSNREIGAFLAISKPTVECHIRNIYKKLAVSSRTQAVYEARASGMLP